MLQTLHHADGSLARQERTSIQSIVVPKVWGVLPCDVLTNQNLAIFDEVTRSSMRFVRFVRAALTTKRTSHLLPPPDVKPKQGKDLSKQQGVASHGTHNPILQLTIARVQAHDYGIMKCPNVVCWYSNTLMTQRSWPLDKCDDIYM